MTGIELIIGDHSIKAALEDGVVSLLIDGFSDRLNLYFFGVDRKNERIGEWLSANLKKGEKLNIRILDIVEDEISDYQKLKTTDDLLLLKYKGLKYKLECKGLI